MADDSTGRPFQRGYLWIYPHRPKDAAVAPVAPVATPPSPNTQPEPEPELPRPPPWCPLLPETAVLTHLKHLIAAPSSSKTSPSPPDPVQALQRALAATPPHTCAMGDRFLALHHAVMLLRLAQESYVIAVRKPKARAPWYAQYDALDARGAAGEVMAATAGLTGEVGWEAFGVWVVRLVEQRCGLEGEERRVWDSVGERSLRG
ncbi:hypothetical protein LTR53_009952 [Teratosphaeriaceae sp. CCFEE 6253]|nr:hypothetical protein LTR53_009952 [Teratosphaeriaceae sp. CCFEE 6253]